MRPPLLGRAILRMCIPESERDSIPGDLMEEFAMRGKGARRWYLRQAFHSIVPGFRMRWGRGEIQELMTLAFMLFVLPFAIILGGGRFVLSQVPLKAESMRASFYIPASLGVSAFCVLLGWLSQKLIGGKQ